MAEAARTRETPAGSPERMKSAKSLAASLPDLLVEARRVAVTVAAGWHGRRQAGPGETFWQFRPFGSGEAATRIDWRRSAKDDHLYVREREWEAAHTVWLWPDLTASMDFHSRLAPASKRDRAVVLLLALGELLARSGERIAVPGFTAPSAHRDAAERLARALPGTTAAGARPSIAPIRRFSDVVVFGDFLDPLPETEAMVAAITASGARGHLVAVSDPAEETFPYSGRTEFRDPETGRKLLSGRAETWREAYAAELAAHREGLKGIAQRFGWSFLLHRTDRSAAEPLLALHARLSASASRSGVAA